jgi:hypothetical protein
MSVYPGQLIDQIICLFLVSVQGDNYYFQSLKKKLRIHLAFVGGKFKLKFIPTVHLGPDQFVVLFMQKIHAKVIEMIEDGGKQVNGIECYKFTFDGPESFNVDEVKV